MQLSSGTGISLADQKTWKQTWTEAAESVEALDSVPGQQRTRPPLAVSRNNIFHWRRSSSASRIEAIGPPEPPMRTQGTVDETIKGNQMNSLEQIGFVLRLLFSATYLFVFFLFFLFKQRLRMRYAHPTCLWGDVGWPPTDMWGSVGLRQTAVYPLKHSSATHQSSESISVHFLLAAVFLK